MNDAGQRWAADLSTWVEKAKGRVELVVEKVCLDLAASIIEKSPVGNPDLWQSGKAPEGYVGGRFRNSWQAAIGAVPRTGARAADASGSASYSAAAAAAKGCTGTIFYLSNPLPYARKLEYGHSTQAPHGMVAVTVAEFAQTVSAAVATAKGKST